MQNAPQEPAPRVSRGRQSGLEAETGSAIALELDGDRQRHGAAAEQRVKSEGIIPDPRIPLLETASSPLPRLGQPVLQPPPIRLVADLADDPRDPDPVIR